ncbi:MAG: EamA family transporter [Rhodospirillales bacterium]|nr:EamA family transporter [Rhodospirillales bacterium]MBO6787213.1 EamA family transporter [Rhodospirillales bacterium]
MPLIGVLAALATVTLWGCNFVAVKVAVTEVPPYFVTAMRFALLAILLSPFLRIPKARTRDIAGYALIMGVGHFAIMFYAIQFLDISTTGIVLQLGTPFVVLLAWLMLKETFGLWRMAGMALAFTGIVILIGVPTVGVDVAALLILVVAAFMWALGSIRAKQIPDVSAFSLIAWMGLIVAPVALGLSMLFEADQLARTMSAPPKFWYGLVYMTLASSIAGYGLWYWLLNRYDVTAVAPYNLLVPLIAVASGVTIMGDELTLTKLIGGGMILGGVSLITVRQIVLARRARRTATLQGPPS